MLPGPPRAVCGMAPCAVRGALCGTANGLAADLRGRGADAPGAARASVGVVGVRRQLFGGTHEAERAEASDRSQWGSGLRALGATGLIGLRRRGLARGAELRGAERNASFTPSPLRPHPVPTPSPLRPSHPVLPRRSAASSSLFRKAHRAQRNACSAESQRSPTRHPKPTPRPPALKFPPAAAILECRRAALSRLAREHGCSPDHVTWSSDNAYQHERQRAQRLPESEPD